MGNVTRISYTISEAAQRAEIAAGRDGSRRRTVDVDLTPIIGERNHCSITHDGLLYLYYYCPEYDTHLQNDIGEQTALLTPDTALDAIRAFLAAIDTQAAAVEVKKQAKADAAAAKIAAQKSALDALEADTAQYEAGAGRPDWNRDDVDADHSRFLGVVERICARDKILDAAKKQAEETAKLAQLTEAVSRLGTPTQRDKWAAGLMARAEAIDLIWAETFAPIMTNTVTSISAALTGVCYQVLPDDPEFDDGDDSPKNTLTDEEYTTLADLRRRLPDATITPRIETGCDADDNEAQIVYAEIWQTVGVIVIRGRVHLS